MLTIPNLLIFFAITMTFLWMANVIRNVWLRRPVRGDLDPVRKPLVMGLWTEPLARLIPHTKSKRLELERALVASGRFPIPCVVEFSGVSKCRFAAQFTRFRCVTGHWSF